jgi:outer membrane protein OmpA-like peptidoglycan-associated protein
VNLGWGNKLVKWTDGLLGSGGWKNLLIQLPFGDLPLPGGILNASVVIDPKSGECSLTVRCFGEWSPLNAGPLFRIPKSAPLTLRLSETGRFSADGTAEAEFSDGGKIRGAIIWRDPNFEFRFEGKAVVIPVLNHLKGLLPADPLAAAPATSGSNDLDDFSLFLDGCQNSIRGLAKGAGAGAPTTPGQTDAPPAATLTDSAGSALEAWSGRIVSWSGDRAGQLLSEEQLQDLTQVIAQSARLGEAAADLPTILRLLRNLLAMADPLESIQGTGEVATVLATTVLDSESRLIAAAQRIATKKTIDSGEMAETATLLGKIAALAGSPTPEPTPDRSSVLTREDAPILRDSFAKLSADCRAAMPSDIFARMGIFAGDTTGTDNTSLGALDADALLDFLSQITEMFQIQRAGNNGIPNIESLNGSTPPLYEAWRQIRDVYPGKEFERAWPAILAHDFGGIRKALARRARYFELNTQLGSPLSCNDPELSRGITSPISTDALIDAFLAEQQKRSGAMLAESCGNDLHSLDAIIRLTTDGAANSHLAQAIDQTFGCLALLGRDNGSATGCSPVYLALVEAGLHPDDPPLENDTPRTLRVTGEYENQSANSPITLQINQAGRLLLGRIQFHGLSTRKTYRERIVGMLKSETADTAIFHILRRRENGSILGGEIVYPGLLVITRTSSGMNLEIRPLSGNTGAPVAFIKTTNIPSGSGVLINLFTDEAHEIFLARQFSPLHSSQISNVRAEAQHIVDLIDAYLATARQSTPIRNASAAQIATALDAVLSHVTVDQVPLARQIMREMLNRTDISEGGEQLSAWNWLRVIFSRHKDNPGFDFQIFHDFMGAEIVSQFSGNAFEYTIHIEEKDRALDLEVGGIGATFLEITITKQRADGSGVPQTFKLQGAIGQLSAGLSLGDLPLTGGSGDDDITVYSDIEYTANMLAGPIGCFGTTLTAGIGIIDISFGPAMLNLYGDGTAPTFTIPLPILDSDNHLVPPSVELAAGFGLLTAWNDMSPGDLSLSAEPEDLSFTDEGSLSGSVQFDVDSATLRHCGEANLRMLVAEMRSVFENTNSVISILGFTDATGTDAHNLALSQARAESVRTALVALVGEGLIVPPENIHAIGLGRQPSMGRTSPNESQLNCLEAQFLDRKKQSLPLLNDGDANPDWRSVTIILNNLVSIDLDTP